MRLVFVAGLYIYAAPMSACRHHSHSSHGCDSIYHEELFVIGNQYRIRFKSQNCMLCISSAQWLHWALLIQMEFRSRTSVLSPTHSTTTHVRWANITYDALRAQWTSVRLHLCICNCFHIGRSQNNWITLEMVEFAAQRLVTILLIDVVHIILWFYCIWAYIWGTLQGVGWVGGKYRHAKAHSFQPYNSNCFQSRSKRVHIKLIDFEALFDSLFTGSKLPHVYQHLYSIYMYQIQLCNKPFCSVFVLLWQLYHREKECFLFAWISLQYCSAHDSA